MSEEADASGENPSRAGATGALGMRAADDVCSLLRSKRSAALASALATDDGWPYVSLVTVACDADGSPILLLSNLSDHTRNLARDARASLLLESASHHVNPQTGARLTLLGRITADPEPRLRRRFLARHPGAALYVDFADFHFFRMQVERAHWVGGFGRARWLARSEVLADQAAAQVIAEAEPAVLAHMQAEHADAVDLYAQRLLGRSGRGWQLTSIDPDGCDLARRERTFARLWFPRPAHDLTSLKDILSELAEAARSA